MQHTILETNAIDKKIHPLFPFCFGLIFWKAIEKKRKFHILADIEDRNKIEGLKDESNRAVTQLCESIVVEIARTLSIYYHSAWSWLVYTAYQIENGGLTGTWRSRNAYKIARVYFKRNVSDSFDLDSIQIIDLLNRIQFYDGVWHGTSFLEFLVNPNV